MKKTGCLILICVLVLLITSCSVSFPAKKPEEGVFYCEELKISVDFSLIDDEYHCAKLYNDDGTYLTLGCHFDYGRGVSFFQTIEDTEIHYLTGSFKWKKNEFIVISYVNSKQYIFLEVDQSQGGSLISLPAI